jgi:GDP-L-fucose synthase
MKEECILTGRLEPTNEPYAIAKIAGIKLCESYNRQYGTRYRSVMPTNLYGPNDNFDLENSHVLPALIRKFHLAKLAARADWEGMKKDESFYGPIPEDIRIALGFASQNSNPGQSPQVILWGSGSPRREFLHVDDLASACVFIMALDDSVYDSQTQPMLSHINVGIGKEITIRELAEIIKKIVGYEGEVVWDHTRPDGTQRKLLDVSKLTNLGWKAGTTLTEGLRLTYKWYLDQSA